MYTLYLLQCSDNSLYTGITNDLENRLDAHMSGNGSKYVRARLPFDVVYTEELKNRSEASKREYEIKSWTREEKIEKLNISLN